MRQTALVKILVVGAGGVGAAFAAIAQRRPKFERVVLADVSPERVKSVVAALGEPGRFSAERVDASKQQSVADLIGRVRPDAVLNACDRLDGLDDGVLEDPSKCHFDPVVLKCKGADSPECLTPPQVAAARDRDDYRHHRRERERREHRYHRDRGYYDRWGHWHWY